MEHSRPPGTLGFGPPILEPVDSYLSYPPFAYALRERRDMRLESQDVELWKAAWINQLRLGEGFWVSPKTLDIKPLRKMPRKRSLNNGLIDLLEYPWPPTSQWASSSTFFGSGLLKTIIRPRNCWKRFKCGSSLWYRTL
jgi:hypothetical protein